MPNEKFTFIEYYKGRYGVAIEDPSQPLLRISNARARHDMMNPVSRRDGVGKEEREKDREQFLQGKTLLVPELVRVHPVPASLWRECQIFPFVVSRVQGENTTRVLEFTHSGFPFF